MQLRRSLIVATLLVCAPAAVGADDDVPLPAGATVRVTTGSSAERVTGTLVTLDDETLTLQVARQSAPRHLRRSDITALDVSGGRRSRARNALIGGAVGAGLGIVVGRASSGDSYADAGAAAVGFLVLTGAGVAVGAAVPPGERWKPVAPDRIRLAGLTRARRVGISASVSF